MPTLRGPITNITKNLTDAERALGVDLKLTKENDLELSNLNDIKLIAGAQNAAQAVKIRLFTEPGGILHHPEIGTNLIIGQKVVSAFVIQTQIIKSLSQDPRFESVNAIVQVIDQTIFVKLTVSVVDTGIEVPLQFSVQR